MTIWRLPSMKRLIVPVFVKSFPVTDHSPAITPMADEMYQGVLQGSIGTLPFYSLHFLLSQPFSPLQKPIHCFRRERECKPCT
ncbi:unnamed protein product [Larinioides sclopetarius]|uniref:Uncharacterized protein n=1 Tax=Larinioides sclopetarius TaxID=280406 RepID=A0AAV1Z015_9ARAC